MKYPAYLLAAALLVSLPVYSDQPKTPPKLKLYSRFSFGPDIFVDRVHTKFSYSADGVDWDEHFISTAVFGGIRARYEYLEPREYYFGTEGLVAIGNNVMENQLRYSGSEDIMATRNTKNTPFLANVEQRLGYAFASTRLERSTLTPFVGFGWYYTRPQLDRGSMAANWFYWAGGLKVLQEFTRYLDLGFNVKATYAFAGTSYASIWSKLTQKQVKDTWGYEVALPFSWHDEPLDDWTFLFEPYLLKLDNSSLGQILGVRLLGSVAF